jgi:hypothetical protein
MPTPCEERRDLKVRCTTAGREIGLVPDEYAPRRLVSNEMPAVSIGASVEFSCLERQCCVLRSTLMNCRIDVRRRLAIAQPDEARVPQNPVTRDVRVLDLSQQLRLDPARLSANP